MLAAKLLRRQATDASAVNLMQLQADCLGSIAVPCAAFGYVWFLLLMWPETRGNAPPVLWAGAIVLLAGSTLAYRWRHVKQRSASFAIISCLFGSLLCTLIVWPASEYVYLLVLPVLLAPVLLGQRELLLVTLLSALAAVLFSRAATPIASIRWQPVLAVVAAAGASWLSARNLYISLEWVWQGYEHAQRNEQVAREGQAELRRTLKALDEATRRLERLNYALGLARDQAEEARRLKQQFAQTISHELRTPLNLIVGFTEMMAANPEYYGEPLPPSYARDISIVQRNAQHLRALVDDVLDLARIEAAQLGLAPEMTDPVSLVHEAASTIFSQIEAKGLTLDIQMAEPLPRVWLDPLRIKQVLINLLTNAVRHTQQGRITVKVACTDAELLFTVADTGSGIAQDQLLHVFEEFRQLDGSARRRHGGAGLGLAISRRFVELHGGRIWAESTLGCGSAFSFSLPLQPTLAPTTATAGRDLQKSGYGGTEEPVLLAITSSPMAVALLSRHVMGARTIAVRDPEQAEFTAQQLAPQVVVVDEVLVDSDRRAKVLAWAESWGLPGIPFVVCPLPGEEPLRQQLEVDAYLIKPVSQTSLQDTLRRFGENVERVLIVDDDMDFVRLMGRMLAGNPTRRYQVSSATTGAEALDLALRLRPDLIVLDLVLPDLSGVDVLQRLRSTLGRRVPVIVVSGQDEPEGNSKLQGGITIAKTNGFHAVEIVRIIELLSASNVPVPGTQGPAEGPAR